VPATVSAVKGDSPASVASGTTKLRDEVHLAMEELSPIDMLFQGGAATGLTGEPG
jgi:hypothetical protein